MVLFLAFFVFLNAFSAQEAEAFPFWAGEQENAREYAKNLTANAAKIKDENTKEVISRIQAAKKQQKWAVAIAELETLVGKHPDDPGLWLDLALAAYRGSAGEGQHRSYEIVNKAERAAAYVYFHSLDKNQRALALLIYAALSFSDNDKEKCLREAASLTDLAQLRHNHPDFADIALFVYTNHEVDRDSSTPQVCFNFSAPLAEKFRPADYFDITPKVDGAFHIRNTKICLTGIRFGEGYNATIREGIPNLFGEKTSTSSRISFLVDNKSPRLTFPAKTYILRKDEDAVVPLTAVNVKKVHLKIVRINDRSFAEGFGRPGRSLESGIYSYNLQEITNRYGEPLYSGILDMGSQDNKNITKQIPLKALVKDLKPGAYGIFVKDYAEKEEYGSVNASQWVIITDLGMTVFKGASGLDVNVRSLSTAKVLEKADVRLVSFNNQILASQTTSSEGLVHFDSALLHGKGGNRPAFVFVYGADGDFNALKLSEPAFDLSDRGVSGREAAGVWDAFVYTERGVYRPGERVRAATILRDQQVVAVGGVPLTFHLVRPDGSLAQTSTMTGNAHGFYNLDLPLPPACRTGEWTVEVFTDPKARPIGQVRFSVEDFVPTRLLVTVKAPEPLFDMRKPLPVEVTGRYLFGSAASGLSADAHMVIRPHPHPFPMHPGYRFGLIEDKFVAHRVDLASSLLNAEGKASVMAINDAPVETTVPLQATIQASIRDEGGRPQPGTLRLDAHAFPYMIGIRGDFPNGVLDFQEQAAPFTVITVNPEGKSIAVTGLHYTLYQEELFYNWSQSDDRGKWEYKPVYEDRQIQEGTLSTTPDAPARLVLPLEGWGYYRLEVRDPQTGAATSSRFTRGHLSADSAQKSPDKLTVVQDKAAYNPGDTVRLHIESPFEGEALLVIANQEVLETRNITVSRQGTDITLKAAETWGTGAYALVSAFRPLQQKGKETAAQERVTPKRAVGLSWMAISPESRTLKVNVTVPKEIKPRQPLKLPLQIEGNLQSETFVTIAAVDDGILMLTDFKAPRPQEYFLGKRMLGVEMRDLYGKILDPMPGEMGEPRSGGDEGILARNLAALSKRSFRIVSLFSGLLALDAQGRATVSLDIPDFNGTLRLMAVAFNKTSTGSGEAMLLVRDSVISEPVLPRFLSMGDTSQMSLSLFNPAGDSKTVKALVKMEGAVSGKEYTSTVTLEKEGAWHTAIPFKGGSLGDGRITLTLSGDGFETITRTFDITVRPASPLASIGATLLLPPGESRPLDLKAQHALLPDTVSLSLMASDQIPWDLTRIMTSLLAYPYGCVEQTISRAFAILYKKTMGLLEKDETPESLDKALFKALSILAEKQGRNGGFPFWSSHEAEDPWLTVYACDFMHQAQRAGVMVPRNMVEKATGWLRYFVKNQSSQSIPPNLATAAYALSLLAGQEDGIEEGAVRYFFDTYFEKLTHSLSRAQTGLALARIGDTARARQAFEALPSQESDPALLPYGTAIRNKAALVKVLLETLKAMPALASLADRVESQRKILDQHLAPAQHLSTQEQAWLLQAGQALLKDKSAVEIPAGKIQLSINDRPETAEKVLSLALSGQDISKGVTLLNKGASPLWIHSTLQGFPEAPPKAHEQNLKIRRTYYTLAGKEVAVGHSSPLTQGDQFIVVLSGELPKEAPAELAHYLLIVDWLPAGFEIEAGWLGALARNTEDSSQKLPWDELTKPLTTEARDDRFVAALKLAGTARTFTLAYRVRAVTPGIYKHPGLHGEDMFIPALYADTAADTIEIRQKKK